MLAKSWLVRLPIGTPFLGAFLLSLSLSLSREIHRLIALNDFSHKPQCVWVNYPFLKNVEQNVVVNAVEEFPHVAFKCVAWLHAILAHGAERSFQILHALVRTFADSARKRSWNESRLKNWIEHLEYRVVEHSISHRRFMYTAQFLIMNQEHSVWSMAIVFSTQFATELKDFVLNIFLKCFHILPIPLIAFENVPCLEQIFCRDYSII